MDFSCVAGEPVPNEDLGPPSDIHNAKFLEFAHGVNAYDRGRLFARCHHGQVPKLR